MTDTSNKTVANNELTIAGAGPAGLAAAITLARAGKQVVVHEAKPGVGWRFGQDFQGLENWTTEIDVLDVLNDLHITTDFNKLPSYSGISYDAWGKEYPISTQQPLFYMVERGPNPGSLDDALLKQAQALGVEIRFNSRLNSMPGKGITAIGPKAVDAIALGYHFETDMQDGYWAICDDELAPKGYAYLLIWNGRGTLKTCMFSGFKQQKKYVDRTVAAFEKLMGLKMINPKLHGGVGNFYMPNLAYSGRHPVAGEQAGFQDTLWGFGMRHAIKSGVLAANSLLQNKNYDQLWRQAFGRQMETSIVNRALYDLLGNRGYRFFLRRQSNCQDVRAMLRHHYGDIWYKRLLLPWARTRSQSKRKDEDESCQHSDCECVWCKCGGVKKHPLNT